MQQPDRWVGWCCIRNAVLHYKTWILVEAQHCLAVRFMLVCIQVLRRQWKNWYRGTLHSSHSRCISRLRGCLQTYLSPSVKNFGRSWVSPDMCSSFFWSFGGCLLFKTFAILTGISMLHLDLILWTIILTKRSSPLFLKCQNIHNSTAKQ